ncbi:DUF4326 domain-containing protein [Massilia sp. SYSU DXS3249]
MKSVLILYPLEFRSQSKFDRKVCNIISNMQDYRIVFPSDESNFIKSLFSGRLSPASIVECKSWKDENVTHAIVFSDGEVFLDEMVELEKQQIPLRRIFVSITRVINIKKDLRFAGIKSNAEYEYIGRGSYWGNPYSMFAEGESREEVIRKYKYDFDYEKFPNKKKSEVFKLAGKRLGCFCKPEACHGDVLANFLNAWDDGK